MSKIIIGFVFGVIVTLAVVSSIDKTPSHTQKSDGSRSSPHGEKTEAQRADPVSRIGGAADEQGKKPVPSMPVGPATNEMPQELQVHPFRVSEQDREQPDGSPISSTSPAKNQHPPEIAEMIEDRVDQELQARYENDEREESWATYMEGQLAAYFAQKPLLSQFYFSLIDCRTSVCSVHAIGYGPDALTRWNTATADLVSQQWMEFNSMSMNRRNPEPDILAIVLILTKKPPG